MLARTDAKILARINGEKRCRGCQQIKPSSEFPWSKSDQAPRSRCYECFRVAARANPRYKRKTSASPSAEERRALRARQIEALFAEGLNRQQIGARGFQAGEIARIGKQLGVPHAPQPSRTPTELVEAVRQLLHSPDVPSFEEIGQQLGVSRNRVAGLVWRYGLNDLKVKPETFKYRGGSRKSRVPAYLAKRRHKLSFPSSV